MRIRPVGTRESTRGLTVNRRSHSVRRVRCDPANVLANCPNQSEFKETVCGVAISLQER